MKIRPVGAELLHADGRTDMKKLTVAFRNFANVPENWPTGHTSQLLTKYQGLKLTFKTFST